MPSKILLFIKSEEVAVGQTFIGRPMSDGVQTHWCTFKETVKTERVIPDADAVVLNVVRKIANEKGLALEIIDVSSFKGKVKAKMKGIKKTPAIVLGKRKLEGTITEKQIVNLLK